MAERIKNPNITAAQALRLVNKVSFETRHKSLYLVGEDSPLLAYAAFLTVGRKIEVGPELAIYRRSQFNAFREIQYLRDSLDPEAQSLYDRNLDSLEKARQRSLKAKVGWHLSDEDSRNKLAHEMEISSSGRLQFKHAKLASQRDPVFKVFEGYQFRPETADRLRKEIPLWVNWEDYSMRFKGTTRESLSVDQVMGREKSLVSAIYGKLTDKIRRIWNRPTPQPRLLRKAA